MFRRLLVEWCAVALLVLVLTLGLTLSGATSRADDALYDLVVGLRAPPASDRILVVAIDDASLAALGQWPWPRTTHARALETLARAGPAAVGYDVLFTEPGRTAGEDAALARALRGTKVALPVLFDAPGPDGQNLDTTPPIAPIAEAATALGQVALPHGQDGTARTALLEVNDGARSWPHLVEQTYRLAFGRSSPAWQHARARANMSVLVPYRPAGAWRSVSFSDLVAGRLPPDFIRNRLILVGATAGGLGDRHDVAGAGTLAGVEVQANLLSAMLADRFVREAPLSVRLAAAALPTIFLLFLFWRLKPSRALIAALATFALVALGPVLLIATTGLWIPPATALLGVLFVYPLWGWRRLHAIDKAIAGELSSLSVDVGEPAAAAGHPLDHAGRNAAALSGSIAALRDLKRLVADTVEGVADPLVVTTMEGEVLVANRRAEALLASDAELRAAFYSLPSARDLLSADGRHFSHRRTPLAGADGGQRGWIHLLAEITDIRTVEREREQALEFLSHDMRSPQASILTLLQGSAESGSNHKERLTREVADKIAYHAQRTLGLAENFVQLARLRETRFAPEETDLHDCLGEASDALWPLATQKGVRIVVRPGEPCCVAGERHALTRAFLNLLDNAVRFSPAGAEIHYGIEETSPEGATMFEAWIEDRGPGIPKERLADLTGRFGPLAASGPGLSVGLGLAYVRAVAERHGGRLEHSAVSPHGSRFTLVLPEFAASVTR
ncbi:CHASE2 domain-containing protein [Sphingomonas sp. JC676]|uniref:CHASE2 domain-containing protein n=1 Tax=Sphingomonas sp. JC676 TaxID=2768065 RepID=UPI00165847C7|nr:CHASE2 domain-containing protein [Sphingomonas sp. JC676]MBC9035192.1 CHASE2 domain-containing protein [Sphingomonas sp. JC676]